MILRAGQRLVMIPGGHMQAISGRATLQGGATYAEVHRDTYGVDEVWPLVDISAGTTITAFVDSARNGSLNGWSLQNAAGPVTGTLVPSADGTNDYGSLYSASFNGIWSWSAGTLGIWGKVAGSGVWTDGSYRYLINIQVNGSNWVILRKNNSANQLQGFFIAGGTNKNVTISTSTTAWFQLVMTWDTGAGATGEMRVYMNGSQSGSTQTSLGNSSDSLPTTATAISAASGVFGTGVWSGWLGYAFYKASALTPTEVSNLYSAASTSDPD